ncbi:MAG TPA: carboxypeptidase-like regulatory domain-containing protein, partial [Longimicrobium sp.]
MNVARWVVLLALVLLPAAARAQVASGTDILRGRVTSDGGAPVAGAQVEVWAAESGVRRSTTTGETGWYTVVVPDGGGRYRLRVSRLGMDTVEVAVVRKGDEEVLTQDVGVR